MRAPFQALVFPFIKEEDRYYYAIFKRKDLVIWQGISGGGEDSETPIDTVKREAFEEANIDPKSRYIRLASLTTIPADNIRGLIWGNDIIVVLEIAFGVELQSREISTSDEHTEYKWVSAEEAIKRLRYDSNKSAIWELDRRLDNDNIQGINKNERSIKEYLGYQAEG